MCVCPSVSSVTSSTVKVEGEGWGWGVEAQWNLQAWEHGGVAASLAVQLFIICRCW